MCLSDEQAKALDAWIAKRNIACPVCGCNQLQHGEPAMIPRYSIDLGRWPGGAEDPVFRLFCPTCAYVLHFRTHQVLNLPEQGGKWV